MERKTDAIVLRATEYKDADKILTLLTPFEGKMTAGIKGVKKAGAKLAFAAQPFAFCEYVLAEKNGRNTVVSAYLHDGFFALRTDIVRFYAACSVTECCEALCAEGEESQGLFVAAAEALRSLAYAKERGETCGESLCCFLLTALFESGYMIDLNGCGACGEEIFGARCYFDFSAGRFLCGNCGGKIAEKEIARASACTYRFLRRCAGDVSETGGEEETAKNAKEAEIRALRLLKAYLVKKTEREYPCFTEFFRLYEASAREENAVTAKN
ncbi:MAG: DNA repair protein RecO [Candidatus Borkfalkiaceae bacterium]|nr:DNA repair protein RecO [Clostridia bacterium]MDY6223633.1 DNA repair protein RecO [Christensenellaceae bacterium]